MNCERNRTLLKGNMVYRPKGNKIEGIYEKETDSYVFVEKTNKPNHGFALEYDGEAYYLIYPQCYCFCVKRSPEHLSKAWCYCTLGYRKRMLKKFLELKCKWSFSAVQRWAMIMCWIFHHNAKKRTDLLWMLLTIEHRRFMIWL